MCKLKLNLGFTLAEGTSYHNLLSTKVKFGFTLAEVLITIGIIGVVAAMTIPTLMATIQHKQTTAKLKKFYSTMKQALISAEDDYGSVESWDKDLPKAEYIKKYFAPYIKGNIQVSNGNIGFQLNDGSIFYLAGVQCVDILYDVNGYSKPNKEGVDRFRFLACPSDTVSSFCDGKGGFCTFRTPYMNTRQSRLDKCKSQPAFCSSLLEWDNWEFKKDYPWRN